MSEYSQIKGAMNVAFHLPKEKTIQNVKHKNFILLLEARTWPPFIFNPMSHVRKFFVE